MRKVTMFSNMFLKIITKKKYVRKHYINSQCFKEKHYFLISLILKKKIDKDHFE